MLSIMLSLVKNYLEGGDIEEDLYNLSDCICITPRIKKSYSSESAIVLNLLRAVRRFYNEGRPLTDVINSIDILVTKKSRRLYNPDDELINAVLVILDNNKNKTDDLTCLELVERVLEYKLAYLEEKLQCLRNIYYLYILLSSKGIIGTSDLFTAIYAEDSFYLIQEEEAGAITDGY